MIYAIVFANRAERGYAFYEHSKDFPPEYLESIAQISNCMSGTQKYAASFPAVRYAPLQDRYLLTLILRRPNGSADQTRSHCICVHFLLDAGDADAFFSVPVDIGLQRAAGLMNSILADRQIPSSDELCETLLSPAEGLRSMHFLPRSVLLLGAIFSQTQPPTRQLFVAANTSSVQELDYLLSMLPPTLRKDLSFHTDIATAQESRGIALNFCTGKTLLDLVNSGFPGSQNTDKFWHNFSDSELADSPDTRLLHQCQTLLDREDIPMYHKLYLAVDTWETYWNFLNASLSPTPLESALAVLPEQNLIRLIQHNVFTQEELHMLSGKTRSMSVKLSIRQALRRPEVRETASAPSLISRLKSRLRDRTNS